MLAGDACSPSTWPISSTFARCRRFCSTSGSGRTKSKTASLSWTDHASNETEFVIERCAEQGKGRSKTCAYSEIATVAANVTSYVDAAGTGRFHYRVKARNAQGDSPYSNELKI